MKYFTQNHNSLQDLKTNYYQLVFKFHPDRAPSDKIEEYTGIMQQINAEYESLIDNFKSDKFYQSEKDNLKHYQDQYSHIFKALKSLDLSKCKLELCGSWLWLSGNTYPLLAQMRALKFQFSKTKKAWYYYAGIESSKFIPKGRLSLPKIYKKYGQIEIQIDDTLKIAQ